MARRRFKHDFKKKWGQNFIRSTEVILSALASLELGMPDRLLEVGPGSGLFTEYFATNVSYMRLVEIDPELVSFLKEKFMPMQNIEIVNGDVLEIDTVELLDDSTINKVFGALPYNISKIIVEKFCADHENYFEVCVFVLQKEVAHSYAGVGKKRTFLNHYLGIFNEIELVQDIEKSHFFPQPKVDSSLIAFRPIPRRELKIDKEEIPSYVKFLRNCFRNPRKKLKSNLAVIYKDVNWNGIFLKLGIGENVRAEELSQEEVLKLYAEKIKNKN